MLEISEKMNTVFEINTLLPSIIGIAKEYLGVKRVSLMLKEEETLKICAHTGFDIDPDNTTVKLGQGIAGKVAESGEETVVNLAEDTREEMGYRASSFMSVPLTANDRVIGVLNLTDKEQDYFTEDDVKIARYIASQCALGVERFNMVKDMRKSENLRIIGMLNSSIAHDIKNLLNIVQSYLDLINLSELDDEMTDYIDSIYTEVKRIHGLTLDLLDFSRQKVTINVSKFYVSEIFEDLKKHVYILTRDTDIVVEIENIDNPELKLDREKMFRVLFNLMGNSIDALGESGLIKLSAEVCDDECIFKIHDNGKGIAEESRQRIFDPFFTSGKVKGTGLGLAIVRMIIEAHNGSISVTSEEGVFTEFTVKVPLRHEPSQESL
ncbi:sensor histidine kinase [Limisalsivibrio acetivorans]|uniref:GAF domain-containing sensor histidine kinase n=1 Tax=Limisalsivibrio acetivorans TaxID=1304888 RepID=UPI0003B4A5ED|nr:GAF domain-containing sensor histidine kinase [Limisalsivibrio acetivorans]